LLEERGFDGLVFVPEGREWVPQVDYDAQIEWEADGLERSSCILFWIPRRLPDMPGFTTNDEFGQWKTSGKVVLGAPPEAVKVNYQRWWAKRLDIPTSDSLEDTVKKAIGKAHHSFRIQQDLTRVWVDHTQ
jgi:hypothetical protein